MSLFKGALYLVDVEAEPAPLSQGFEPSFGNAIATRQWLQQAFAANEGAPSQASAQDVPEPADEAAPEVTG